MDAEMEAVVQEIMDQLMKHMPLPQFIDSQGPLRFKHWVRRLAAHPKALAEFHPLVIDEAGKERYPFRSDEMKKIVECVERHPVLKTIADREWRMFHAHNLRAVLFRDLPAPKVKSREWKKIYDQLENL